MAIGARVCAAASFGGAAMPTGWYFFRNQAPAAGTRREYRPLTDLR